MPTATQSGIDQRPLLVDRSWFLVSYNNSNSKPGSQEPFTRFNQDGTLIGFTGCKNFNGAYQTEFNRLTIASINLSSGSCPDQSLQVQEDMMVAILRSARSYLVADTTLQITGDAGFLNYSLTPPVRPQEIPPPQAVIQSPPQAHVGQIVIFDGSQSTGQSPIVSWRWQFGDGHRASGMIVQHAFASPSTFAVQLDSDRPARPDQHNHPADPHPAATHWLVPSPGSVTHSNAPASADQSAACPAHGHQRSSTHRDASA